MEPGLLLARLLSGVHVRAPGAVIQRGPETGGLRVELDLRLQNSGLFTGQTAEDSGQGRTCRFHFS